MTAYALVRFTYRPKVALIGLFILSVAIAFVGMLLGGPPALMLVAAAAVFAILAQTIGRRSTWALANSDIAFWLISQRILPPIAVAVPLYVLFQQVGLLDSLAALIVTYVATNIPIVVWLMRDYFSSLPRELEESASVDGASIYRIVRSIVLPISVPGLVATFLIVLIFSWNEFLIALVLTSADAQTMPLQVAAQNATRGPQWWAMSVLILIMIAPGRRDGDPARALHHARHPGRRAEGLTMTRIVSLEVVDLRFPTSRALDGSDAMNPDPDYSAAYVILRTDAGDGLEGHGLTFTIGRGTEVVVAAVDALRPLVVGLDVEATERGPRRVLAGDGRRQPAALDRAREGGHPPGHRRGRQRRVGPRRQARGQAAVAAAGRDDAGPDRRARRLPLPHRRAHARSRRWPCSRPPCPAGRPGRPSSSPTATRPTRRRWAGWATTTRRSGGSRARRWRTAGPGSR